MNSTIPNSRFPSPAFTCLIGHLVIRDASSVQLTAGRSHRERAFSPLGGQSRLVSMPLLNGVTKMLLTPKPRLGQFLAGGGISRPKTPLNPVRRQDLGRRVC